ncbi:hypothetical protein ERO13_A11G217000v2 [Gossypium hirsutum]|uniref:ACB domain-containing protein n=2 Tax=Gossypium TaxID=3633 RepID=A0A5J5TTU9_GOSBA|nr:hypothetical protein ES319_A11G228700v1 [Gossypium barbadense]KAG4175917.1 hypothetical protein ERO13_A11G217000v2 [Gossypium hirsutum]TYI02068.1 hypothetical protein ES332_A11G245600v1 [Gossypium tomentosum]
MELLLEFLFTLSLSFVLSFIIAKLLSLSSVIDQHLEAVSRCMEVSNKSEKCVLECEKGLGFVSEVVKFDALGESVEEKGTLKESLNDSHGPAKISEVTVEEISSGEENFGDKTTEIGLAEEDEEEIEVLEDCLNKGLSDDDWEGIERTELEKDFGAAVCFLESRNNADQILKLGNNLKMQLYALQKVATEGPCHETHPMAFKLSARAKWNAWKRLGNVSPEAAMEQYITLLSRSIPGYGESKQHSADVKASWKLPLDAKTMPANKQYLWITTGLLMRGQCLLYTLLERVLHVDVLCCIYS